MNFLMPVCRFFLNLLGVVVILSLTCSIGHAQLFDISEQDELQLGAEAAKTVEKQQSILQDKSVGAYVNHVGQKLAQSCNRNQLKYSFKVVNTPEINAFALPGGFVYVNRGLGSSRQ